VQDAARLAAVSSFLFMSTVSERTWSEIVLAVRARHPELVRAWFGALEPAEINNGVISIRPPNRPQYQYLQASCLPAITEAAQTVTGRLVTVQLVAPPPEPVSEVPLSFETESLVFNPDYTFPNFVTGPSNQLAHAACLAVADNPGRAYNPLFIHGSVGLGKTHLLQATCQQIKARQPDAKVLYLSCETFTNHFVEAIERGALNQFRYRYRHVDVLVIDDIQFLASREQSREEFFHTFNTLFQSQKQIILSGDESPKGIPSLEDRLVSRFSWGLVTRIDSPCLETRMAIVRKKAKLRCIELPEDVIHHIAARATSNTRELEGALTMVLALAQQYGGNVDLDIARKALGEEAPALTKKIGIPEILQQVMERFNVRLADLQGKRRHRSISHARQICMYLARQLTTLSLGEVGGFFGGRDHTTVLHAVKTIGDERTLDSELDAILREMTDALHK
jgi:chromosomal replication initiator protein